MDAQSKTFSTEPGNYTEPHLLLEVPTEVLVQVRIKAHIQHMRAGGHGHAARMALVERLITEELAGRDISHEVGERWGNKMRCLGCGQEFAIEPHPEPGHMESAAWTAHVMENRAEPGAGISALTGEPCC